MRAINIAACPVRELSAPALTFTQKKTRIKMAKNIKDVELFLFDLDGTVYIGDKEIEGSFAAVNRLREMGKRICFSPTTVPECTRTISQD